MKMWISRTKEHGLYLAPLMPKHYGDIDFWCYSKEYDDGTHMLNAGLQLDSKLYPEVTFENSPMEVELVIKKKEQA